MLKSNTKITILLPNSMSKTKSTPTVPPKIKSEFPKMFSDKLGKVKRFRHRVKIRSRVKPVQQKLRRIPFTFRDAVSAELRRLEEASIVELTGASEWTSPIVVAWKKSGQIRVCVDLRKLNEAVVENKFPLPTVDEMLSEMPGATHFSKQDLKSAYHQLELGHESRDLTAFVTHVFPQLLNQSKHDERGTKYRAILLDRCPETDADRAFNIKSSIVNSPGLALFDHMNEVIVTTDASGYGPGWCLLNVKTMVWKSRWHVRTER